MTEVTREEFDRLVDVVQRLAQTIDGLMNAASDIETIIKQVNERLIKVEAKTR